MGEAMKLTGKQIKDWADKLPDNAIILGQVVGSEDGGAWSLFMNLSDELKHFRWEGPVYAITMSHPNLKSVNPHVRWES